LIGNHAVGSMIRDGKTFQLSNLMQSGRNLGMQTMDMALEKLVRAGTVDVNIALEKAEDKENFKKLFAPGGAAGSGGSHASTGAHPAQPGKHG
jgi:twitching motility protein PilT